jgi:hypothetical protein
MSSVAVIGGVIAAGGSIAAASMSNKSGGEVGLVQDNPQADQLSAIGGNIGSQSSIEQLLGTANTFNQAQANSMANQATPGLSGSIASLMQQSQSDLANQYNLPDSVKQQLMQQAAEQNVQVGNTGQSGGFNSLRSLGINQLAYGQQQFQNAMGALTTAAGISPRISPMSPMSFYVTPQQQTAAVVGQNQDNQQIAQGGNNANAAASNARNTGLWNGVTGAAQQIPWGSIFGSLGNMGSTGAGNTANAPSSTGNVAGFGFGNGVSADGSNL